MSDVLFMKQEVAFCSEGDFKRSKNVGLYFLSVKETSQNRKKAEFSHWRKTTDNQVMLRKTKNPVGKLCLSGFGKT